MNSALPGGSVGSVYSAKLAASGGSGSYSWSIASGTPPPGVTVSGSTLTSTSPLATVGSYKISVSVLDLSTNLSQTKSFTIFVGTPPSKEYIRVGSRVVAIENP
jgi:large repetitive protein